MKVAVWPTSPRPPVCDSSACPAVCVIEPLRECVAPCVNWLTENDVSCCVLTPETTFVWAMSSSSTFTSALLPTSTLWKTSCVPATLAATPVDCVWALIRPATADSDSPSVMEMVAVPSEPESSKLPVSMTVAPAAPCR